MLRKTLSITLLIFSLSSCSLIYEFRDLQEIEGWRWNASESCDFTYSTEEEIALDGVLLFRHVQGFQHPEVSFRVEIESKENQWDTTFVVPIRDQNGDYLGEGSVDLWDVEHLFFTDFTFEFNLLVNASNVNLNSLLGICYLITNGANIFS